MPHPPLLALAALVTVGCTEGGRSGKASSEDPLDLPPGPTCDVDDAWPAEAPFNSLLEHLAVGEVNEALLLDVEAVVEVARGHLGPWAMVTDGPYRSIDGVHFEPDGSPVRIEAFSVPELVIDEDGRSWLIGVNGDLDELLAMAEAGEPMTAGVIGFCGLMALTVGSDGSVTRQPLSISGEVPACVVDPDIRATEDGGWRMSFLGIRAEDACWNALDPARVPAPHQMYTAWSDDLSNRLLEGVAAEVPVAGVDPAVWCDGLHCGGWMSQGLWSEDGGRSFVVDPIITVETYPDTPDVVEQSGGVRMYFGAEGESLTAWADDGCAFETDNQLSHAIHTAAVDLDGSIVGYQ